MPPLRLSAAQKRSSLGRDNSSLTRELSKFHGHGGQAHGKIVLDRYLISAPITGGMSTLFQAIDLALGRQVVIKMASSRGSVPIEISSASIQREAEVLMRLRHQNIVRMFSHGTYRGIDFLILEYLGGEDMHELLDVKGKLTWSEIRLIALQICSALEKAHRSGITHGDLKPENVVLDPKRALAGIVLVDFGLATLPGAESPLTTDMLLGTIDYMAPEAIERSLLSPMSDVFSLGVMMYEALAGWNPFFSEDLLASMERINKFMPLPPNIWTQMPSSAARLVMKAISKDPGERFQDASEMKWALLATPV